MSSSERDYMRRNPDEKSPVVDREVYDLLSQILHDNVAAMQAAWIEWRNGDGAEAAMQWIENTLEGPGMLPDPNEPHAANAQMFFALNRSNPNPPCGICGAPSPIAWMDLGACSSEHLAQLQLQRETKR